VNGALGPSDRRVRPDGGMRGDTRSLRPVGSLYGYEVISELPLGRLNRARGARGTINVRRVAADIEDQPGRLTGYLETPGAGGWFAQAETADGCLLSCSRSGAFHLDPEAMRIDVAPRTDGEEFEHRLATAAFCTLLAMRGDLVLHASAIEAGFGAVAFCGPSHRGKSTLARALGELGHPVLAEDGAVIERRAGGPMVLPGARGVRVRRSENGSTLTELAPDPGPREPGPSPLAALVVLGERGESLKAEWLDRATALALLTSNLTHTGGRDSLARAFASLARVLHTVPVLRASLPDDLAALPGSAQEVLRIASSPR